MCGYVSVWTGRPRKCTTLGHHHHHTARKKSHTHSHVCVNVWPSMLCVELKIGLNRKKMIASLLVTNDVTKCTAQQLTVPCLAAAKRLRRLFLHKSQFSHSHMIYVTTALWARSIASMTATATTAAPTTVWFWNLSIVVVAVKRVSAQIISAPSIMFPPNMV